MDQSSTDKIVGIVYTTDYIEGPFMLVATVPEDGHKQIIAPEGGYKTTEEAAAFVELFAKRKEPYCGMQFEILSLRSEDSFGQFLSWEE